MKGNLKPSRCSQRPESPRAGGFALTILVGVIAVIDKLPQPGLATL